MIVSVDAAQLEWRTIAELSGDEAALSEILNKEDTHSKNQITFNLPSRLISKIYLFRTIFRGSGWSFANDPDFMHVSSSPKYWEDINEKFYNKYKGIDQCHKEWCKLVVSGKPIIGPLGRFWKIELGKDLRGDLKIPWTTLTNYPVQGTGADIMMIARISFYNRLKKANLLDKILLVSSVHDSICVDCLSQYRDVVAQMFTEVFEDLPKNIYKLFHYEWKTPLGCEVKAGPDMANQIKLA